MNTAPSFTLRPRLLWRLGAPVAALASSFGLASANGRDLVVGLIGLVIFVVWSVYLWSARVELADGSLTLWRFGRATTPVRLEALRHWDQSWAAHPLPTPSLEVEDVDGNNFSLEAVWWSGWSLLKQLVIQSGAPKPNVREQLGPRPVRTSFAGGLVAGVVMFASSLGYFLLTSDDPISISLGAAGVIGGLFSVGTPLVMLYQLRKSDRDKSD